MREAPRPGELVVGIDTHKHVHTAVAVDALGARLGATTIPVGARGYRELEAWACSLGAVRAFGIEGTGSYGAGLSRFLRALARCWLALDEEIKAHDARLERLTEQRAPELVQAHGIGAGTAAEMLLLVGDNPERIRSEAAFAKLCGACPIPAPSGKTSRHRLNRGGNRQANAALYRVVLTRMRGHQPTREYVRRRTAEGRSTREIVRCLKRYVAREIFGLLCAAPIRPGGPADTAGPNIGASPRRRTASAGGVDDGGRDDGCGRSWPGRADVAAAQARRGAAAATRRGPGDGCWCTNCGAGAGLQPDEDWPV